MQDRRSTSATTSDRQLLLSAPGAEQPPELPDLRHLRRRPTRGRLGGSLPDATFRIDLFASAGYGRGGSGEAEDYLGRWR